LLRTTVFRTGPDAQGRRQQGQSPPATGQQPTTTTQTTGAPTGGQTGQQRPQERPSAVPEEIPVITHHEITVGGKTLKYTATVGMMPIKNREARLRRASFSWRTTLDDVGNRARRPLTFSFNGGPESRFGLAAISAQSVQDACR